MEQIRTITVEEYNTQPPSFKIIYGCPRTPFGKCYLGVTDTDKAIVHLAFPNISTDKDHEEAVRQLQKSWPKTELRESESEIIDEIAGKMFDRISKHPLLILMKGTDFQLKVWKSLMDIPPGTTTTYSEVAASIDKPKAVRAVGNAVMQNKIAYLVPCHRVMGKSGSNKYAWGPKLKQDILDYESNS